MNNKMINLTCNATIKKQDLFNELIAYIKKECELIEGSNVWYYDCQQKDNDGVKINYKMINPEIPSGVLIEFLNTSDEVLISEVVCYNSYGDADDDYWSVVSKLLERAKEVNIENIDNQYLEDSFSDDDIARVKALHSEVGGDLSQIELTGCQKHEFKADGGAWLVLTDEEAEERAKESCQTIVEDCILGSIPTFDNGKNTWLRDTVEKYFNAEAFIEDCISIDGRGHSLAIYDHEEREQTIEGVIYYIYRTN